MRKNSNSTPLKKTLKKPARAKTTKTKAITVAPAAKAFTPVDFYREYSQYTNPGLYAPKLKKDLPNDIEEIGLLVRNQLTHRKVLENGRLGVEIPEVYGDMTKVPWYRQPEDDIFITAAAMLAELYRRDAKGFHHRRAEENRIILTCRYVSVLVASILKTKGIPARVRSGFAPYFNLYGGRAADHWVTEYWLEKENRWVMIDVDGSLEAYLDFDPYDVPPGTFIYSADAWLDVRSGKRPGDMFWNAADHTGLMVIAWELFYDYHCLMSNEVIYVHVPEFIYHQFDKLSEKDFADIDELAVLLQKPEENFAKIKDTWEKETRFRILRGGLL